MLTKLYGKIPSKSDDSDLLALLSGHYVSSPAFNMSQQVTQHRWAFLLGVLIHTHSKCIYIWDSQDTMYNLGLISLAPYYIKGYSRSMQ